MTEETLSASISEGSIKVLYAQAYSLYNQKYYDKAEQYFHFLILQEPKKLKHWVGLGACQQMQKNYEQAVHSYSCAALLDEEEKNPAPHLYAAQCLIALKETARAKEALDSAECVAKKSPAYIAVQNDVIKLRNLLKSAQL